MKRDELFIKPPPKNQEDRILFAGVGLPAGRQGYTYFNDECFIIADGVRSLPHADVAERLAVETALWAYKVVRLRPFYWKEKPELVKRIFRTTNLTLWQKRRDPGYANGLASSLSVLLVGPNHFWVGTAGNTNAFLFRESLIEVLTPRDVDEDGMLTRATGFARPQLIPHMRFEGLLQDDVLVLASDGIMDNVSEDELRSILEKSGNTTEMLEGAAEMLVDTAKSKGGTGHMAVCLVKRVVVS